MGRPRAVHRSRNALGAGDVLLKKTIIPFVKIDHRLEWEGTERSGESERSEAVRGLGQGFGSDLLFVGTVVGAVWAIFGRRDVAGVSGPPHIPLVMGCIWGLPDSLGIWVGFGEPG